MICKLPVTGLPTQMTGVKGGHFCHSMSRLRKVLKEERATEEVGGITTLKVALSRGTILDKRTL